MNAEIRKKLFALADAKYQKFSSALVPNANNILGVRLPALRRLAREIAQGDWRAYLQHAGDLFFEETMLQGLVIGYVKADVEEVLRLVERFVPKISNWSVCDSFCTGLKFAKKHRPRVWEFLQPYLSSPREFEVRFAAVMLLLYFVEEEYLDRVLQWLERIRHDGYYAKMAVAWAISVCYVKFPERTLKFLRRHSLDADTHNKALQKIIESARVGRETKNALRNMKRNR